MSELINYALTINGDSYDCEIGAVVVINGTEKFDSGTIVIKNITLATEFNEFDDVILTVGTIHFDLIVQADRVERVNETKYDHTVTLTEETAKLTKSYSVDRYFTLNGTNLFTHWEILQRVQNTTPFGKSPLYTVASATQTALGTPAPQKKFEGLNQFQIATDCMRGINAVARLSNGVLSHEYYNVKNNPITLSNIIGWQKDNDINNYATTVISRVKNMTYDLDLTTGATWWPNKTEGSYPRSSEGDYSDDKAQYQLGLDIRRTLQVNLIDVELSGGSFIDMDITDYVVSKEEYDGLLLGSRNLATLITAGTPVQRNTLYYTIGDNVIVNMGTEWTGLTVPHTVMETLVKTWLVNNGYLVTDFKIVDLDTYKLQVHYQPYIDATVSSEKWDVSTTKYSEILNNQKDTIIDIGRYGEVSNAIANRLNNGNWLLTIHHADETEILYKNDYTSDNYKVIIAKYEFYPNEIIGTYELSKDWTTIDGYQSIYKSTDPYTIGRDNVKSNYLYREYLEFSSTLKTKDGSLESQGIRTLMNIFSYDSSDDLPVHKFILDSTEQSYDIVMDTMSVGARGLKFISSFKEPKNAGYSLYDDGLGKGKSNLAVPYTDEAGYMSGLTIEMYNDIASTTLPEDYPKVTTITGTRLFSFPSQTIYKNPNEIFGINIELVPCTDEEGIIVTKYFSIYNNLVNDGTIGGLKVIVFGTTGLGKYTIFDEAPIVTLAQTETTVTSGMINKVTGVIDVSGVANTDSRTWAIATTTDKLLLAVNYNGTSRNVIYMNNLLEKSTAETL